MTIEVYPQRRVSNPAGTVEQTAFTRQELSQILVLYGFFVASGEWRDYAIDNLKEAAVFSIFRRASEAPLYRVEKRPKLARKQSTYSVITTNGHVLKRGNELGLVLKIFDRQKLKLAT